MFDLYAAKTLEKDTFGLRYFFPFIGIISSFHRSFELIQIKIGWLSNKFIENPDLVLV